MFQDTAAPVANTMASVTAGELRLSGREPRRQWWYPRQNVSSLG